MEITEQITFIYVRDLTRSKEFYENLLGFELVLDQGSCRIVKAGGDAYLGYCQKSGGVHSDSDLTLTFVTSEVDRWYQKLINAGETVHNPPAMNKKFQIYHFYAQDPDGYRIEFQDFLDPEWNRSG